MSTPILDDQHHHHFTPASVEALDEGLWQPFRPGVDIVTLRGTPTKSGSSALLRYQAGASVPTHRHLDTEYIFVISGSQEDDAGRYPAGTVVINTPNSEHQVRSETGCVVLAVWTGDIEIL